MDLGMNVRAQPWARSLPRGQDNTRPFQESLMSTTEVC
jgi:hypothetical protein